MMNRIIKMGLLVLLLAVFTAGGLPAADWTAQWIGIPEPNAPNSWLCFRKQAVLGRVSAKVPVRIACDSKYWLWVNGLLVVFEGQLKRGPKPSDTYYDDVDLAPHLRTGTNTLAVLVWYWGKHGFSHNSSGKAGLILDAGADANSLCSDTSWRVMRQPAYGDTGSPHPNYRLPEPNIRFDARLDMNNWQAPEFNEAGWTSATAYGRPPVAPWGDLVARPIPLWKDSGLQDYENPVDFPAISTGGVVVAKLPHNAHVTPYLKIEAPAGLTIDIRTDDYLPTGAPSVRAEYVTRAGVQDYESYGWMNGHEVRYTIPAGVKILTLKYRETGYDADFAGSFKCSDPALNRLWEEARQTLYVTMRDTYMDCPDRERAQWWGDAVNELGEAFYVFDSARGPLLAKKGMLELANWQRPDHTLYAPVPAGRPDNDLRKDTRTGCWNSELPPQMLASIGWYGFWTYYWYTGDRETLATVYPAVKRYLSLWKFDGNGQAIHRAGDWDWADWGTHTDGAILDSAWLYLALKGAVEMAHVTAHESDVAEYTARMQAIQRGFNTAFWKGDHYQSAAHRGDIDDRANAMAVIAGLAKPEQYPAIRRVLATQQHASPYMEKYVLEALYLMGAPDEAVSRMKERYASMLADPYTTLWENFGGKGKPGDGTYNHAWSGGPLTLLSQYAAGIAPTATGWKTFAVRPQPGPLTNLEASVSTPQGMIAMRLQQSSQSCRLELEVPTGAQAVASMPPPASGRWNGVTVDGQGNVSATDIVLKPGRHVIVATMDGHPGQWLQLTSEQAFSEREFEIGQVRDVEAYLANRRYTSCWMEPVAGTDLASLPRETQFLLLRLRGNRYLAMVALLDGAFRCGLRAGPDGGLRLLAESGDRATVTNRVTGLYLEEGTDPYALVASAAARLRARYHDAKPEHRRQLPDFARTLGWCSWNAFYTTVSQEKLLMAMEQFRAGGVQPGFVVIDDGWFQSTNSALASFEADTVKFPGGLGEAVRTLKTNYGVHEVLLWQAYNGYWRGLAPSLLQDLGGRMIQPSFPGWIAEPVVEPAGGRMDTTASSFYPAIYREPIGQPDIAQFYARFHERLKGAGVDGVKLDAMTWIESLGNGRGGRVAAMRELVRATERSEQRFFDRNVIWCSSCSSDCILLAPRSAVMRSSTDYFPDKPESHGHHLAINAHASLWMGEFVIPDWDMFQSGHWAGAFHAAARALSGGPVYVADELGKTDFALLKKLCFSDRTVPLCAEAARPAPDSLFLDPGREDRLFKIFNRNPAGSWVVGVFHCSYRTNAPNALSGFAGPGDVHGIQGTEFAVYRHGERYVQRMNREAKQALTLQPLGFEILTIAPVAQGFAAIGLADKFNSGGCVESVKHLAEGVEVGLRDSGEFLAWMDAPPKSVSVAGISLPFDYDARTGTLRVMLQPTGKLKVLITR